MSEPTKQLSKEAVYEKVTMQELGGNPNGTRQEIVWKAMDEYALLISIAFVEWILRNDYQKYTKGIDWWFNEPPTPGKQTYFNSEQLYKLFLTHTSNIK